jgi:hypothetical protein
VPENRKRHRQPVRREAVVVVEKGDEVAARRRDPRVERCGDADIGLVAN